MRVFAILFATALATSVWIHPNKALAQNVQQCVSGRYVSRTALALDRNIAGTYSVGIPESVTDRTDYVNNRETITTSAGAGSGVLQIMNDRYVWTDSAGHPVTGRFRLFEPGNCQTGSGMAHVVVEGGTLDDTVYVVSDGAGKIGLYSPETGYIVYAGLKR